MGRSILLRVMENFSANRNAYLASTSAGDKEYLAQNWIEERLKECTSSFATSGRNSYPDFWAEDIGFESKSLSIVKGRPARSDLDFNSTLPTGTKDGKEVYVVTLFYDKQSRKVDTICLTHGSFFNDSVEIPDIEKGIRGFGTYGDGYVRIRKMYVFPHQGSIVPEILGKITIIAPFECENDFKKSPLLVVSRGSKQFNVYEF